MQLLVISSHNTAEPLLKTAYVRRPLVQRNHTPRPLIAYFPVTVVVVDVLCVSISHYTVSWAVF